MESSPQRPSIETSTHDHSSASIGANTKVQEQESLVSGIEQKNMEVQCFSDSHASSSSSSSSRPHLRKQRPVEQPALLFEDEDEEIPAVPSADPCIVPALSDQSSIDADKDAAEAYLDPNVVNFFLRPESSSSGLSQQNEGKRRPVSSSTSEEMNETSESWLMTTKGSLELKQTWVPSSPRPSLKHGQMLRSPSASPSRQSVGLDHLDNLCRLMEQLAGLKEENNNLRKKCSYLEDTKILLQAQNEMLANSASDAVSHVSRQNKVDRKESARSRKRLPSADFGVEEAIRHSDLQLVKRRTQSTGSLDITDNDVFLPGEESANKKQKLIKQSSDVPLSKHEKSKSSQDPRFKSKKITKWERVKMVFTGKEPVNKLQVPNESSADMRSDDSGMGEEGSHQKLDTCSEPTTPMVIERATSHVDNDEDPEMAQVVWMRDPGWEEQGTVLHPGASDDACLDSLMKSAPSTTVADQVSTYLDIDTISLKSSPVMSRRHTSGSSKHSQVSLRSTSPHRHKGEEMEHLSRHPGGGIHHAKTAWGRVKDIIHTRKDSIRRRGHKITDHGKGTEYYSDGDYVEYYDEGSPVPKQKFSRRLDTSVRSHDSSSLRSPRGSPHTLRKQGSSGGVEVNKKHPDDDKIKRQDTAMELQQNLSEDFFKKMEEWERKKAKSPSPAKQVSGSVPSPPPSTTSATVDTVDIQQQQQPSLEFLQKNLSESFNKKMEEWDRLRLQKGGRDPSPAPGAMERKSRKDDKGKSKKFKPKSDEKKKRKQSKERPKSRNGKSPDQRGSVLIESANGEYLVTEDFAKKLQEWEEIKLKRERSASELGSSPPNTTARDRSKSEVMFGEMSGPHSLSPTSSPGPKSPNEKTKDTDNVDFFCNTPDEFASLENTNKKLASELAQKEAACKNLEMELDQLKNKIQEISQDHHHTIEKYRHELWAGSTFGHFTQEKAELERVMSQLRLRLQDLEHNQEQLVLEKSNLEEKTIKQMEQHNQAEAKLLEELKRLRSHQLAQGQNGRFHVDDKMKQDIDKFCAHILRLYCKMNDMKLGIMERNKLVKEMKRQMVLQEVTNLLLEADSNRRGLELNFVKDAQRSGHIKRWKTFHGTEVCQRQVPPGNHSVDYHLTKKCIHAGRLHRDIDKILTQFQHGQSVDTADHCMEWLEALKEAGKVKLETAMASKETSSTQTDPLKLEDVVVRPKSFHPEITKVVKTAELEGSRIDSSFAATKTSKVHQQFMSFHKRDNTKCTETSPVSESSTSSVKMEHASPKPEAIAMSASSSKTGSAQGAAVAKDWAVQYKTRAFEAKDTFTTKTIASQKQYLEVPKQRDRSRSPDPNTKREPTAVAPTTTEPIALKQEGKHAKFSIEKLSDIKLAKFGQDAGSPKTSVMKVQKVPEKETRSSVSSTKDLLDDTSVRPRASSFERKSTGSDKVGFVQYRKMQFADGSDADSSSGSLIDKGSKESSPRPDDTDKKLGECSMEFKKWMEDDGKIVDISPQSREKKDFESVKSKKVEMGLSTNLGLDYNKKQLRQRRAGQDGKPSKELSVSIPANTTSSNKVFNAAEGKDLFARQDGHAGTTGSSDSTKSKNEAKPPSPIQKPLIEHVSPVMSPVRKLKSATELMHDSQSRRHAARLAKRESMEKKIEKEEKTPTTPPAGESPRVQADRKSSRVLSIVKSWSRENTPEPNLKSPVWPSPVRGEPALSITRTSSPASVDFNVRMRRPSSSSVTSEGDLTRFRAGLRDLMLYPTEGKVQKLKEAFVSENSAKPSTEKLSPVGNTKASPLRRKSYEAPKHGTVLKHSSLFQGRIDSFDSESPPSAGSSRHGSQTNLDNPAPKVTSKSPLTERERNPRQTQKKTEAEKDARVTEKENVSVMKQTDMSKANNEGTKETVRKVSPRNLEPRQRAYGRARTAPVPSLSSQYTSMGTTYLKKKDVNDNTDDKENVADNDSKECQVEQNQGETSVSTDLKGDTPTQLMGSRRRVLKPDTVTQGTKAVTPTKDIPVTEKTDMGQLRTRQRRTMEISTSVTPPVTTSPKSSISSTAVTDSPTQAPTPVKSSTPSSVPSPEAKSEEQVPTASSRSQEEDKKKSKTKQFMDSHWLQKPKRFFKISKC